MPFTLSHPLFAVPLQRLVPRLSIMGLALGSMAPDMEYFIAMVPYRTIGHSWQGLFLQAFPLCIALAIALERILRPTLRHLLPWGLVRFIPAAWLADRPNRGWQGWTWFLISVALGFLTHLFIDGWTHADNWFTDVVDNTVAGLPLYKWLQYSFSVIGLAVPALLALMYGLRSGPAAQQGWHRPTTLFLWGAIATGMVVATGYKIISSGSLSLSVAAVAPLTGGLLGWYIAALFVAARQSNRLAYAALLLALSLGAASIARLGGWTAYILVLSAVIILLATFIRTNHISQQERISRSN